MIVEPFAQRQAGRQSESDRARVLRGFDHVLHAGFAFSGSGTGTGRAGRRGAAVEDIEGGGILARAAGGRDAI